MLQRFLRYSIVGGKGEGGFVREEDVGEGEIVFLFGSFFYIEPLQRELWWLFFVFGRMATIFFFQSHFHVEG
jgi:hypothetical protein